MSEDIKQNDVRVARSAAANDFAAVRALGEGALRDIETMNPGFKFKFCRKCGETGILGANHMTRQIQYCLCVHKQVIENRLILVKEEHNNAKEEKAG